MRVAPERPRSQSGSRRSAAVAGPVRVLAITLLLILVGASAPASAAAKAGDCRNGLVTAKGCESPAAVSRHLERILGEARSDYGLKAAIARIDAGRRTLLRTAIGRSQAGVAARRRMHFRIGSMAIPWLTTIVLQLRDEGRLGLNDKISKWFPNLPRADQITVRMLATTTSGYNDYLQTNYRPFIDRWYANPFRRWTPGELLDIALSRGMACDPGCFNYAHTNYILLSRIVQKVTGQRTSSQMNRRILKPLGLDQTEITAEATIPSPVLHGFTSERGFYEDSTTWSPSWTLGSGTIATSTIDDVASSARGILSGRLLSRQSRRTLVAGTTASPNYAFGLIVLDSGWRVQNPQLNGYGGVMAYLPRRKLSFAVTTTSRKAASLSDESFYLLTFGRLAAYLAPEHPTPWGPAG